MLLSSVVSDGAGEWFQLLLATVRFGTRRSRRRNPWHSRANPWHCRFVLCAGGGQPLVEPDGLVSVGAPRGEQRDGQIDVGGAGGAQVREARAGELGAELRVLGRGDVLRGPRVRAGDEAAISRRAGVGAAEYAEEQGGDR